jgi:glycosyltransferase involved in cell wall biosynthesis
MNVLFIHQAFPAQFGRLALELTKRYGWTCDFLVENLSSCPTPSAEMLEQLKLYRIQTPAESRDQSPTPWPQIHAKYLGLCGAVFNSAKGIPDLKPDLIVGHGGRGSPTVFLPDLFDCPLLNYCEYYFSTDPRSDISYRVDLPPATDVAPFFPRCINAPVLVALTNADGGYSATHWQKQSFPKRFHHKIEVQFDGIDTEIYCPKEDVPRVIAGRTIPKETKIVTFVARGLESMRGFDVFMKVAARIARQRSDVLFVIAGNDHAYYGWDPLHTGQKSFKSWVLDRVKHDPDRFLFTGHVLPEELADILRLSDLHLYLTVPFVLSWSLLNAMACGCVVLGSDVPPVREVIDGGVHGLIEPLFDLDRLTEAALRVLDDPAAYKPLGEAARDRMENDFSLDACVPRLKDYFERMASRRFQTQPTENSESPKPKSRKRGRKKTDNTED